MDTVTSASRLTKPRIQLEDPSTVGYETEDEIDASRYQVVWTNVMEEGQYVTPSTYLNVMVLILCWAEHSSDFDTQEEVSKLQSVFEEGFRYQVTVVSLDAKAEKRLQVQLNEKVAGFVGAHDGPNTLLIVYYAGHGKPGEYWGDLEIFGQTSPNDPRDPKSRARNRVVWNKTEELLRPAESDVLEIFDCCYAGTLGLTRGDNCRLFEYLAAAGSQGTTEVPGPTSFTSALTFALESLREEKPESRFTTDELLRKITKEAPHFPKNQCPVLSDREHKKPAGGRIMLHPLRSDQAKVGNSSTNTPWNQWNGHVVTMHFEFGEGKPSEDQVRNLGRHFNHLFERNTLGVHRVRWGGMRRSTFGLVARTFRGSLRKRRASGKGRPAILTKYGGPRSSPAVTMKNIGLLSPQTAEFEGRESVGDESSGSIVPSSFQTSDIEGEPDTALTSLGQSHETIASLGEGSLHAG